MNVSTTAPHGLIEGDLTEQILGAAIDVHRALGPGLLESAYQACMCRELSLRRIPFRSQVLLPVHYKGLDLDCGYRIDLVVNERANCRVEGGRASRPHPRIAIAHLPSTQQDSGGPAYQFQCSVVTQGHYQKSSMKFTTESRKARNYWNQEAISPRVIRGSSSEVSRCREPILKEFKKFRVFRASVVNKLFLAAKRSLNPVKWVTPGLRVCRHLGITGEPA